MEQITYSDIERLVYIWARYSGIRDTSEAGKHYTRSDIEELIERLQRFKDNPDSFDEGFEKEKEEKEE